NHRRSIATSAEPMFVFDDANAQWKPIAAAPFDRDLELVVIDSAGVHALSFPCRRAADAWVNVETGKPLYHMRPTHWREWPSPSRSSS
ncbi:MAG: hypothetical protein WAK55_20520, partial [Xanthobacteraceae bacterium]